MLTWNWFCDRKGYDEFFDRLWPALEKIDSHIAAQDRFVGYCTCCERVGEFVVKGGAQFGNQPNLREGMICTSCGLTNRQRLLQQAMVDQWGAAASISLLEQLSGLYVAAKDKFPNLIGSEYLGHDCLPGSIRKIGDADVRHESATNLSFENAALDGVVHNDILEHIPNYREVFTQTARVLKTGGVTLFCCPFFATRDQHLVRALQHADGSIEHLEPPEFHGDPVTAEGILAFYHFGWQLLDEMKDAGFSRAEIGVLYEPFAGFVGNYHPDHYGFMLPCLVRAIK